MYQILALWAIPRSVSTAFERMMIQRGDFEALHEPFSVSYYFSEKGLSNRYSQVAAPEKNRFEKVLAEIH